MKKLIIMAVAAVAVSAQAASINWNSGSLKQPTDGAGTFGSTNIGNDDGHIIVWFFATLGNANDFVTSGYTDGTQLFISTVAGEEGPTKDSTAVFGNYQGLTGDDFAVDTTYFTVAYVQTTITGNVDPVLNNTWYMYSGVGEFTTPAVGNTNINFLSGAGVGGSSIWQSSWTPVPEPTTGLMALAGIGMLFRRRRKA